MTLPDFAMGGATLACACLTVGLILMPSWQSLRGRLRRRSRAAGSWLQRALWPAVGAAAGWGLGMLLLGLPMPSLLLAALAALGLAGRDRWLRRRHRAELHAALIGVIDLMVQLLPAGHGVRQSLQVLSESGPAPMREELSRLLERARESSLEVALLEADRRLEQPLFTLLAASLQVGSRSGGRITPLLQELSRAAHQVDSLRGQLRAEQAQGRLGALVIAALPLVLIGALHLSNPGYLAPYDTPSGQLVLTGLVGLVAFGYLWMLRILELPDPDRIPLVAQPRALEKPEDGPLLAVQGRLN